MKRKVMAIIGQSNEVGNGETYDRNSGIGCPIRDPLGPNGYAGSMWPHLSELMGKHGVWLNVLNTALGSTSIVENWCGWVRTWASNILCSQGTYIISSDSGLWRSGLAQGTYVHSTASPTGTGPTATTGDGITWTYIRAATATDISNGAAGYVFSSTDGLGCFDPNGVLGVVHTQLTAAVGYDEKWILISFGQQEKTVGSSAAQFATAYINVVNWALAYGYKVAMGFTNGAYDATMDTYWSTYTLPGYATALANFAGNANVLQGQSLYASVANGGLGPLTIVADGNGIGVQADGVHMNRLAKTQGAKCWFSFLAANGFLV